MLRIQNPSAPPETPAEAGPDVAPEVPTETPDPGMGIAPDQSMDSKFTSELVDPTIVHYMTPDMGPFACSNCEHFGEDGASCNIVAGPIDPQGICNLFTPPQGGEAPPEGELPPELAGMGEADNVEPVQDVPQERPEV